MFDQNLVDGAGHRLSMLCAKRAKGESRMSALKSWHRATLIVVVAGLAVALVAWITRTDPAINYLPRHRDADWRHKTQRKHSSRRFAQMFHIATSRNSSGFPSLAKSASPDVPGAGTQR